MPEHANKSQPSRSGKIFKFVLIISFVLGVILTGIVSMNLDSLRKPITDELSQITGLSIKMESLNLSLSNGLSLRGGKIKVNSKNGSHQIFSAEELYLNAELEPLLKRQLKIKKIILVKPTIETVLESKPDPTVFPDTSGTKKTLDEEIPSQPDEVENLGLPRKSKPDTNFIGSIRKLLKSQNLSLHTVEMKDAALTLIMPKSNSLPVKKIPILVDAQFHLSNPNPDQFNIDGNLSILEAGGVSLTGTLRITDLLGEFIPLKLNLEASPLPITKIDLLATELASQNVVPVRLGSGEVEKLFIHLEGLINPNHNPLKEMVVKSGFKISNLEFLIHENREHARITLPHFNGEGVWKEGILNYKINGNLLDGRIESNLVFNLPKALEGSFIGTFDAETKLEKLNLALIETKLPDKWKPITGLIDGSIKVQGSVNKPSSPTSKYSKLLINNFVIGSETPITVGQARLYLQQKSPQQTLARIQLKDVQHNNVSLNAIGANIKIFPEKISMTNGRLIPSNGVIFFSGDYHPQSNTYIVRINGKKLRIEDFLAGKIEGSGFFKGMFQGNLNNARKIWQKGKTVLFPHVADSLSGKLSIHLKDVEISASPGINMLFTLLEPASGVTAQKQRFNFNTLVGDLKIWEGKALTDNFKLKGPQMNIATLMAANLATGKLDGEIKVMPRQLLESITKTIPLLENFLTGDVTEEMAETYFRLGGTLEKPTLILEEGKTLFGEPMGVLEGLVKTPKQPINTDLPDL